MCTLAWGKCSGELWVCFNRDEMKDRPAAEWPRVHRGGSGALVYARDPVGGGTWFAASARGFVTALLNHYPATGGSKGGPHRSRGQLVLKVAGSASLDEAGEILQELNLREYEPFHLFLVSQEAWAGYTWDGSTLVGREDCHCFWTTSSHNSKEVCSWRRDWWRRETRGKSINSQGAGELLRERHLDLPAYGPAMDRPDARTVSQIEVAFRPDGLTFSYRPRDPAGHGFLSPKTIHVAA